jgi:LytR cell envelope-related transcriptional attenuator
VGWRTPITLLVLLGVLLGAGYYGYRTVISPSTDKDKSAGPTATCTKQRVFHRGQKIVSRDIVVNVYNAGSIANLASDTLAGLHNNGFLRGVATNAPSGISATNVSILTRQARLPQVRLVARQFKGHVKFRKSRPLAAGIDVVVGDGFKGMKDHAAKSLRLSHVVRTCTHLAHQAG